MIGILRRLRHRAAIARREYRIARGNPVTPILPLDVQSMASDASIDSQHVDFDGERAFAHLLRQCDLGFRIPGTPAHSAAREYITRHLIQYGARVATQTWMQRIDRGPARGQTIRMVNVLASFGPCDAPGAHGTQGAQLMFCTHYDTRPVADRDPDPERRTIPVTGANDGASGVAVLLELARCLAAQPPRQRIDLAFFDGEDLGEYCYGSRFYARTVRSQRGATWLPHAAIVIDMVGKSELKCCTEIHSVRNAPDLWRCVHDCARQLGFEQHFGGRETEIHDDHVFVQKAGVPAILLLDPAYPQWHTTRDLPVECSAGSLHAVGALLLEITREN